MSKFASAAPYIACFVILRRDDEVAFVLRSNTGWMDGQYGLASGKVEWGETYTAGAIREAKEEAGITIKPEHVHHAITVHRHSEDTDWVDVYFEVDEWEGEPVNAEPAVHSELAWLNVKDLPENVIPGVRFALDEVAMGNHFAEDGWETT
jgi:8-oxo-dGTP pyrophosphatase MutT (NUDIX family)